VIHSEFLFVVGDDWDGHDYQRILSVDSFSFNTNIIMTSEYETSRFKKEIEISCSDGVVLLFGVTSKSSLYDYIPRFLKLIKEVKGGTFFLSMIDFFKLIFYSDRYGELSDDPFWYQG
jgi:hypothetical protein